MLKPFDNCRVYDPCCGSGGMFVQSVKFIQAHSGNRNRGLAMSIEVTTGNPTQQTIKKAASGLKTAK